MKTKSPTFDRFGRMQFHPDFHPNHGKPWKTGEEQYLIDYYGKLGPEQVSLELGRTIHTVMQYARKLRRSGRLRSRRTYHRRTLGK